MLPFSLKERERTSSTQTQMKNRAECGFRRIGVLVSCASGSLSQVTGSLRCV